MVSTSARRLKGTPSGLTALFVFKSGDSIYLAYQNRSNANATFSLGKSEDGFAFSLADTVASISQASERLDLTASENFRVVETEIGVKLFWSGPEKTLHQAQMSDVSSWKVADEIGIGGEAIFADSRGGEYLLTQEAGSLALRKKLKTGWGKSKVILSPRPEMFDDQPLSVHHLTRLDNGWLLLYHLGPPFIIGAAVLDLGDPTKVNWRGQEPIWWQTPEWQGNSVKFIGAVTFKDQIISYWQRDEGIFAVVYAYYRFPLHLTTKNVSLRLQKHSDNPLILPKSDNSWEAFNTFNPAAVYLDNRVHILYRAQGYDYVSTVGYASSSDGLKIDRRLDYPVFSPKEEFEFKPGKSPVGWNYMSGGGYGGIEDPRTTVIGDRLYMTYVAFDGWNPPRVALTSIAVEDFLAQRWLWEKPILISPPGVVDKSAVIFPEKIKGKYCIFHRVYPNILIDFVDNLNFDGSTWLTGQHQIRPRFNMWDSRKLGAGAPPLKTKDGWLLIYQAVDERDDSRYKVGAMLLDLNDPTQVIVRSNNPILEPETSYENQGFKGGVVYPCGAVIIGETLFVYYGAADSYVAVATANLDHFLAELKHNDIVRLDPARIEKVA